MRVKAGPAIRNRLVFSPMLAGSAFCLRLEALSALGGETSDDPWRTFRPLSFRPFHDLFMKKRQSGLRTRCGQRSTNQPRG